MSGLSRFDTDKERIQFMKKSIEMNEDLRDDEDLIAILEAIESDDTDAKNTALIMACWCFLCEPISPEYIGVEFAREAIAILTSQGADSNIDVDDIDPDIHFTSISDVIATADFSQLTIELIDHLMDAGFDINREYICGADGSSRTVADSIIMYGAFDIARHILKHRDKWGDRAFSVQGFAREVFSRYQIESRKFDVKWYYLLIDHGLDLDSPVFSSFSQDPTGAWPRTLAQVLGMLHNSGGKIDPSELRRYQIASLSAKDAAGNGPVPKRMPAL